MGKKEKTSTTRRGFVKEVTIGTAGAAVTGALAVSNVAANPTSQATGSLEERFRALEKKVTDLEDIAAINRLQYAYNYYVEHMLKQEIIDCFADDPNVILDWLEGKWKGKAGVKRYFDPSRVSAVGFRHQLMPTGGLITLSPDGKTAKGRWYAFGGIFMAGAQMAGSSPAPTAAGQPQQARRSFVNGIYEMGYIKENGIWKILSLKWIIPYALRIGETKVGETAVLTGNWSMPEDINRPYYSGQWKGSPPDVPVDKGDLRFVTGYIFPFHFKHPVTGKETSENELNKRLKPVNTGA